MNKKEEAALKRAAQIQQGVARLYNARFIYGVDHMDVLVPIKTLYLIEPDASKWDYKPTNTRGCFWAIVIFADVKFKTYLSEKAHIDVGGYGIQ